MYYNIKSNLLNVPCGHPFSQTPPGVAVKKEDMIFASNIPNKMSQRAFYEKVCDLFGENNIIMKIYQVSDNKLFKTFEGSIDEVRSLAYNFAMKVGATKGRRKGNPNKDFEFEITAA